jgi:hypothetical protein
MTLSTRMVYIYYCEGWLVYSKFTLINDNAVTSHRLHFMVNQSRT